MAPTSEWWKTCWRGCEALYHLCYCSLRCFNAVGVDASAKIPCQQNRLIPRILEAAEGEGCTVPIYGMDYSTPDGTCIRDYVHVNDLAAGHVLALEALMDGRPSAVYNLGTGQGYSVRQVIEAVRRITGASMQTVAGAKRDGDPAALVADSEKIASELGWTPAYTDLNETLRIAWLGQDGAIVLRTGRPTFSIKGSIVNISP
jgi:UDP-glucose 4-epimerase